MSRAAARAVKLAEGTGKTVVIAILIGWQTLNKVTNKQDARFSDALLIVSHRTAD
jgi:type III restriction enzyme